MLDYIDSQLAIWPLARDNYQALGRTERRGIRIGDLTVGIQHNPARIVSTGAKTDSGSIAARPCFLCKANRPPQQHAAEIAEGWELLVNPYPIFPTHFTIVSSEHKPQEGLPLDMITMAERLPGHTVFFNGKKAGASCPDHLHCQAVKTHELPLMRLIESSHTLSSGHTADSTSLGLDVPAYFVSVIITPDMEGMQYLSSIEEIFGKEFISEGRINVFAWIDDSGLLRLAAIPRRAHRPACYGAEEGQRLVSPGSIDMAGVMITPLKKDYDGLTEKEVRDIYKECSIG